MNYDEKSIIEKFEQKIDVRGFGWWPSIYSSLWNVNYCYKMCTLNSDLEFIYMAPTNFKLIVKD